MFLAPELLQLLHATGATAVPALGRGMLLFAPSAPVHLAQTWVPLLEFLHLPEARMVQSDDSGGYTKIKIPDKECLVECRLSPISASVWGRSATLSPLSCVYEVHTRQLRRN